MNLVERLTNRDDLDCRKGAERIRVLEAILWRIIKRRTDHVDTEVKKLTLIRDILVDEG